MLKMLNEEAPSAGGSPKTSKSYSNTPVLNQFGRDLTEMAREAKFTL